MRKMTEKFKKALKFILEIFGVVYDCLIEVLKYVLKYVVIVIPLFVILKVFSYLGLEDFLIMTYIVIIAKYIKEKIGW